MVELFLRLVTLLTASTISLYRSILCPRHKTIFQHGSPCPDQSEKILGKSKNRQDPLGILETRSLPARYGRFETAAETIALGLRRSGFRVIAACEIGNSSRASPHSFQGIKLVYFPVKNSLRPLSETIYDVRSLLVIGTRVDAIYMLGYGAGFFFWIARLLRKTLVVNSDGMEWKRPKFGRISRFLLRLSERFGLTAANVIVADSKCVCPIRSTDLLQDPDIPRIWNGIHLLTTGLGPEFDREMAPPGLSNLVKPDDYYLVLARMEPDNNIDRIVQGFTLSRTTRKLLLVGALHITRVSLTSKGPRGKRC